MKFPFHIDLNDNFRASNCRDISKQTALALPPNRTKFPKNQVGIRLKLSEIYIKQRINVTALIKRLPNFNMDEG